MPQRLNNDDLNRLLEDLGPGWELVQNHHLTKLFGFEDFITGLAFVNRVAEIAERANHHPDVFLGWGRVRLDIWTHSVDGLCKGDFVLADQCDGVFTP